MKYKYIQQHCAPPPCKTGSRPATCWAVDTLAQVFEASWKKKEKKHTHAMSCIQHDRLVFSYHIDRDSLNCVKLTTDFATGSHGACRDHLVFKWYQSSKWTHRWSWPSKRPRTLREPYDPTEPPSIVSIGRICEIKAFKKVVMKKKEKKKSMGTDLWLWRGVQTI